MSQGAAKQTVLRIVARIIQAYSPQKVILYGSHAYGSADPDSDIDLLIIKETDESFFDRLFRVRQAVSGLHTGIPFDPIVLTPQEMADRLQAGDQFLQEVLEKGETLYAA